MTPLEFQAVVLAAGKGSRMTEITGGRPKCLLPIANMPMVWYPLRMLEREGFQDAIVIVADVVKNDVQFALEKCNLSIRLDIVAIPPGKDDWGTADSLHFISDKIKADVVIVSCDFITDVPLYPVLDLFRNNDAAVTMLFLKPPKESLGEVLPTPGPKAKQKPERDLVGMNADTQRLVLLASVSDYEDTLPITRGLLRKHPHLQLHSRLLDSHVYVLRRWICKFLSSDRSLSTLKGELLPYIVRKQSSNSTQCYDGETATHNIEKKDIYQLAMENIHLEKILSFSSCNDHWGDMKEMFQGDKIRCYAHIADDSNYGIRVNTLPAYSSINREILHRWNGVTGGHSLTRLDPSAEIRSTQVDDSCLVGDESILSEKTSFRASSIGSKCSVKSRTRITDCVIMNNVTVNEGCILSNCVICDGVEIGSNTQLKNCLVGCRHVVSSGEIHSQQVLADEDLLMEI